MPRPRIYLDHVASTPMDPLAREAMVRALTDLPGNASSPHLEGRAAKDALEEARNRVAGVLGCRPREIVFTSGGTEALQIGLRGVAHARRAATNGTKTRVVISAAEHTAVRGAAEVLAGQGFEVLVVGIDGEGRVDPQAFLDACGTEAAAAALMAASHESGALFPVAEVGKVLRERSIPLVCDAAMAPGRIPLRVDGSPATGGGGRGGSPPRAPGIAPLHPHSAVPAPHLAPAHVDLLALSGHKFGGPPGTGCLYIRRRTRVERLLTGGVQEEKLRPGAENVPAAIAFSLALERAVRETPERALRYRVLADRFLAGLAPLGSWRRLGPEDGLPGLLLLEVPGVEGEAAMINLDLEGIAVSTGSTCALGGTEKSPGLLALGLDARRAASTIRVSFGEGNVEDHAVDAASTFCTIVRRVRSLAGKRS